MTWDDIWNTIVEFFRTSGLQIVYAILVLIIGLILIKIINKIVQKALGKTKMERITQGFIRSIVKVLLYAVLIFAVLQMFGIPITGLVTVLATAGAAIALSLKDSLSNVASGMILISNKIIKQGDYVKIDGEEGTVSNVRIMFTQIITTDNKTVTFPNSLITTNDIVNYSTQGSRCLEMEFDVAYETDIDLAKKVILDVCHSNGKIKLDPAPAVNLKYFKDSNITLFLQCWTSAPYWEIYYYIMEHVYNEFKRNNISIAYDQVEVRMRNDTVKMPYDPAPLPTRVEPEPEQKEEQFNIFDISTYDTLAHHKGKKSKKKDKRKGKQPDNAEVEAGAAAQNGDVSTTAEASTTIEVKATTAETPVENGENAGNGTDTKK